MTVMFGDDQGSASQLLQTELMHYILQHSSEVLHWDSSSLCPTSAWASVICPPFPQTVSLMLPAWCCPELPYRLLTGQHNERHKRSVMLLNMCVLIATVRRDSGDTAREAHVDSTENSSDLTPTFYKNGSESVWKVIRSIATRLAAGAKKQNHIYFHATFKPLKSSVKKKKIKKNSKVN